MVAFVARGFESLTLRNFPDMAQWLAQVAYIHRVGGSSPSIGTNSDVDEWFSHHADTVGALHNVGSNPTVTTNGEYTLRLIPGRKVNWLHVGSIPSSPTNI